MKRVQITLPDDLRRKMVAEEQGRGELTEEETALADARMAQAIAELRRRREQREVGADTLIEVEEPTPPELSREARPRTLQPAKHPGSRKRRA